MKILKIFWTCLALMYAGFFTAQPTSWNSSNDYSIKFSGANVNGFFKGLEVDITFDENNPSASKIVAGVNANTLNTGIGLKNKHAKSNTGIDAKNHGMITFVSKKIVKKAGAFEATGTLTLKGTSHEVILPFTFERIDSDAVFKGKFSLKPKDYGVTRHGTPETIDIDLEVRVTGK